MDNHLPHAGAVANDYPRSSRPLRSTPATLNLATLLLDDHVDGGHGERHAIVAGTERITLRRPATAHETESARRCGVAASSAGDRVAMRFLNNIPFAATWLAGAEDPARSASRRCRCSAPAKLAYIANDSGAEVFVCQSDLIDELKQAGSSFDHHLAIVAAEELIARRIRSAGRRTGRP